MNICEGVWALMALEIVGNEQEASQGQSIFQQLEKIIEQLQRTSVIFNISLKDNKECKFSNSAGKFL